MREIIFRAWAAKDNCWVGGFCIHNSGLYSDLINAKIEQPQKIAIADAHWKNLKEINEQEDRIIIMQSTGIKDKNGKEIYEGDILKNNKGLIRKVWWNETSSSWGTINLDKNYGKSSLVEALSWIYDGYTEIIGNIYENPELLK